MTPGKLDASVNVAEEACRKPGLVQTQTLQHI